MNTREYSYITKKKNYLVRVHADVACRGGESGKGCITYVWELDANNEVQYGLRTDQGKHSEAMVKRLIKAFH